MGQARSTSRARGHAPRWPNPAKNSHGRGTHGMHPTATYAICLHLHTGSWSKLSSGTYSTGVGSLKLALLLQAEFTLDVSATVSDSTCLCLPLLGLWGLGHLATAAVICTLGTLFWSDINYAQPRLHRGGTISHMSIQPRGQSSALRHLLCIWLLTLDLRYFSSLAFIIRVVSETNSVIVNIPVLSKYNSSQQRMIPHN